MSILHRTPRAHPLWRIRAAQAFYRFRESLFAMPTLVVIVGVFVEEVMAYIDARLAGARLPMTVQINSNAATWLLSTVAGATITTAGVVFSLTVVSLQLASSQFSPRVMRSFIRDRVSQFVIGLLVATFVYCVLALRHIDSDVTVPASPRLLMTGAVVLTVSTVLFIIAYLNRLARGLQVGEVVRTIAGEADDVVTAMARTSGSEDPGTDVHLDSDAPSLSVHAVRDGWVTRASSGHVLAAVPAATTVRMDTRVGAYIHRGEPVFTIWPIPSNAERTRTRLQATVVVADTRTMQQDVDFALRQLVDIALRALSSAINDPTTAIELVLRLGSILRTLLTVDAPPLSVAGHAGRRLIRPWELTHEDYIEHAFEQIRQASTA